MPKHEDIISFYFILYKNQKNKNLLQILFLLNIDYHIQLNH